MTTKNVLIALVDIFFKKDFVQPEIKIVPNTILNLGSAYVVNKDIKLLIINVNMKMPIVTHSHQKDVAQIVKDFIS
jgi:hypothetical protein